MDKWKIVKKPVIIVQSLLMSRVELPSEEFIFRCNGILRNNFDSFMQEGLSNALRNLHGLVDVDLSIKYNEKQHKGKCYSTIEGYLWQYIDYKIVAANNLLFNQKAIMYLLKYNPANQIVVFISENYNNPKFVSIETQGSLLDPRHRSMRPPQKFITRHF